MNIVLDKYICHQVPNDVIDIILKYIGYIKYKDIMYRQIRLNFIVYNTDGNGFSVNNKLVCINGNYYFVKL